MENYQLYRTNVLLSGLMKWDLILNPSTDNKLYISDFHISPISKRTPYNKYLDEVLLNYKHGDNLKKFYKSISSSFYNEFVDPLLSGNWPIICKPGDKLDTHESTYEMGCRRMNYNMYLKLFEFFCPIWLEKLSEDDILEFKIKLIIQSNKDTQSNKEFEKIIQLTNITNNSFHNKFVNYFLDYLRSIKINQGNDNLLSVHLTKGSSLISGVDIKTGNLVVRDLPVLVKNLLLRERPLMEFDSMLIKEFERNNLISPQLFNFNFCFNIEDIIPKKDDNGNDLFFFGLKINISIQTSISKKNKQEGEGSKLELVDFFSNYDFIHKKEIKPEYTNISDIEYKYIFKNDDLIDNNTIIYTPIQEGFKSLNVLSYLKDYKCIDLINQNKINQSIIHWSLYDNNDYILNAYEGFSGYSIDLYKKILIHNHLYGNTPDLYQLKYSRILNNAGWCNFIILDNNDINPGGQINQSIPILGYKDLSSDFNLKWVNNIKYKQLNQSNKLKALLINIYGYNKNNQNNIKNIAVKTLLGINNDDELKACSLNDTQDGLWFYIYKDEDKKENYIFFISYNMNELTFANIRNQLSNSNKKDDILSDFLKKLLTADSSDNPPMVYLKKSLFLNKTKGPTLLSNELEYYKDDNNPSYVLRYSGKIKPTFLKVNDNKENNKFYNNLYYKDYLSDDRSQGLSNYQNSIYSIYLKSGLPPLYPSIGYYSLKYIPMIDVDHQSDDNKNNFYNNLPEITVSEFTEPILLINSEEYSWFNKSIGLYLIPELKDDLEIEKIDNNILKNKIKSDIIAKKYKIDTKNPKNQKLIEYIYTLYEPNCSFEYMTENKTFKYTIELKLK